MPMTTRSSDSNSDAALTDRVSRIDDMLNTVVADSQDWKKETNERLNSLSNQMAVLLAKFDNGERTIPRPPEVVDNLGSRQDHEVHTSNEVQSILGTCDTVLRKIDMTVNDDGVQSPPVIEVNVSISESQRLAESVTDNALGSVIVNQETRLKNIDILVSEGKDTSTWLNVVEQSSVLGQYTDPEKFDLITLSLKSKRLHRRNWEISRAPFIDYQDFREILFARCYGTHHFFVRDCFFDLTQNGYIEDYINDFEEVSSKLWHLTDESLESLFRSGLKPPIQAVLKMLKSMWLKAALEMNPLLIVEMCDGAISTKEESQIFARPTSFLAENVSMNSNNWKKNSSQFVSAVAGDQASFKSHPSSGFVYTNCRRHLSTAEFEEKKKKGFVSNAMKSTDNREHEEMRMEILWQRQLRQLSLFAVLGLMIYFKSLEWNFEAIGKPITEFLLTDKSEWRSNAQVSFDGLTKMLQRASILCLDAPTELLVKFDA